MAQGGILRVGLIGAGYIARWHAEAARATPGLRLSAVCDPDADAAGRLARALGVPHFARAEDLLAARVCDAVHILTPPQLHAPIACDCLRAGLHVLVEKPVGISASEVDAITEAAAAAGRQFGAGHNFLGLPSWERLKRLCAAGDLGRIGAAEIRWALPLSPLRSGPYGLWMLREDGNLLREIGPHPFAFAVDLFGPLAIRALDLTQPIALPGNAGIRHQGWRILAAAGHRDVTIHLSLVETAEDRSVTVRGSAGVARLDYAADTLVLRRDNASDLIVNPLRRELAAAAGHLREGLANATRQATSLNRLSPYGLSFRGMMRGFYGGIRSGRPDPRFAPAAARAVMAAIDSTLALMPPAPQAAPPVRSGRPLRPPVMVIGGTGYLGRALTRALVRRGHPVRVASRGRHMPFADLGDMVQAVPVSLRDGAALAEAMAGCACVFNLARSLETTWQDALDNEVGMTLRIGGAAAAAGVGRLVHTGTIASYDMSDPRRTITEETPFGDIAARNLYARSKAEGERRLIALAADRGLALSIARPGIVVGGDGPLRHWGIGRWHGSGAVRLWGNGRNILPFVLVEDVAEGLVLMMETPRAAGQSFNLVGEPMLSARDYVAALRARLGAGTRVASGSLTAMWAADAVKWALKRHVLGQREAVRASRRDWLSRGHLSRFDNSRPKAVLGWQPEADRERFLARALDPLHLFGF